MSLDVESLEATLRRTGTVFLDHSVGPPENRRHLLFSDPLDILIARRTGDVNRVLAAIDDQIGEGRFAAGYLAYEAAGAWIETGVRRPGDSAPADAAPRPGEGPESPPLAWFGIYDRPTSLPSDDVALLFDRLSTTGVAVPSPRLTMSDDEYMAAVEAVRDLIREGDVYQVNFTGRFESRFIGDAVALYGRLRSRQPVEYGAFIECGEHRVLSLSPELFFRRTHHVIETRPMKGTAPRGRTPEEDAALAAWLAADPKSRAENLMIVDLLRNDLSIVCDTGSVEVPDLYRVEAYPTLFQMISRVTGRLRPGTKTQDLFRALFPCGSVTGAPKRRAMRRIAELEPEPRGVYCGAVGFVGREEAVFNVAIRTATTGDGRLRLGAGSGVVWDSDAHEELSEARLKTAFFGRAPGGGRPGERLGLTDVGRPEFSRTDPVSTGFSLIETMLVDEGGAPLMEAHLDRVMKSARYFGWNLERSDVEAALRDAINELPGARHRLRMLVGPSGVESVETAILHPGGAGRPAGDEHSPFHAGPGRSEYSPVRVGIARTEVHSANPFLRHKTTRRDVYDRAMREAAERGLDEVILVNELGEITEGAVTNVFLRLDGEWFTPPPSSGLLPGVARAVFMGAVGAAERPLTTDDVRNAEEIVLTNAVRGARRAILER